MYKLTYWANKIKGFKNTYSRLQWLLNKEKTPYVTPQFIDAAKTALDLEYKNMVAFLDNEKKKLSK